MNLFARLTATVLVCAILCSLLGGCAGGTVSETSDPSELKAAPTVSRNAEETTAPETAEATTGETTTPEVVQSTAVTVPETTETVTEPVLVQETVPAATEHVDGLTDAQRNSMNMLNHLAVLTQEINTSKNSRLFLENVYSQLVNNSHPNAIDEGTLAHIVSMLDTLEDFRMIEEKRERLKYIYEQQQAEALRSAIPNPLGLISATQSRSLAKVAASVVYMAIDSVTSYEANKEQAELQYLQEGWVLDDAAAEAIHESRKETFSYMVRTVAEYDLPGDLALNEDAVDRFVEKKNNSNVARRIEFLNFNEKTYQALGIYWLTLAESYYENGQFRECLDAVDSYEKLNSRIFRKDYEYARILPLAIIAAGEVYVGDKYIEKAEYYVKQMWENTDEDDWAAHYFAAQTYLDLFSRTKDREYLEKAFELALYNITQLADTQEDLNAGYLAEVQEAKPKEDATKEQKKEIKAYNKMLKEIRETELPPVCEPLMLNCDLVFALAEKYGISDLDRNRVEQILYGGAQPLFLTKPLEVCYSFTDGQVNVDEAEVIFDGEKLTIPAWLVSQTSVIQVTVKNPGESAVVLDDWNVTKVKREKEAGLESFTAVFKSEQAEDVEYKAGAQITIEILAYAEDQNPVVITYRTVEDKKMYVFNGIGFERVQK